MSTPNNIQNAQPSQTKANNSTGPSTPAALGNNPTTSNPTITASAVASSIASQNNANTPRSNPPTMHPSPANHRSPLNIRSPATARSVGATPMARAASNASGSGLASSPMQRGHTAIGLKSTGTPGKAAAQVAGKTVAGSSALAAGAGLGIGQPGLTAGSPNLNESSPNSGRFGANAALNSITGLGTPSASSAAGTVPSVLAGGIDMDVSLSGLGFSIGSGLSAMGSSTGGRLDDEERRRRLESVLDTLRKRPGRVSREAVERLARRCELDMHLDEDELSLAGKNAVMLEVQFKPKSHLVERVSVNFPTASDELTAHASKASTILQDDLTPHAGIATINASLDRFADNLERLARLDKLSIPGANCFEAVFGVYSSLRKLYEHEKKAAEALFAAKSKTTTYDIEMEVLCKKSGSPKMHARKRVGLSLDYWKTRHLLVPEINSSRSNDEMETDGPKEDTDKLGEAFIKDDSSAIASMTIECEASSPALYPPIRITDAWVSDKIGKNENDNGNDPVNEASESVPSVSAKQEVGLKEIEWQEPAPPAISTVETDSMLEIRPAHPTQPQARFMAKFEPPLVLPWDVASWVLASVDANAVQENPVTENLEKLLLSYAPGEMGRAANHIHATMSSDSTCLQAERTVLTYNDQGKESSNLWDIRLFPIKTEAAIQIQKLPFSHPRQLVMLLPILRQYMFLSDLLKNTISIQKTQNTYTREEEAKMASPISIVQGSAPEQAQKAVNQNRNSAYSALGAAAVAAGVANAEADLDTFLSTDDKSFTAFPRVLDIALSLTLPPPQPSSTLPLLRAPRLTVAIPGILLPGSDIKSDDHMARVTFTILPNADIDIELEDLHEEEGAANGHQDSEMTNASGEEVDSDNTLPDANNGHKDRPNTQKIKSAVLQAMMVSEDLATWAEWLRTKFPA